MSAISSGGRGGVLLGGSSCRLSRLLSTSLTRDVILFSGAVDGDLDSDLTTFDFLPIHLLDGLLLQFLRSQRHETETTALAGLVPGLQLLNHEARDRAQSDLGRNGLVVLEDFLELYQGRKEAQSAR